MASKMGLMDIVPLVAIVTVRGREFEVRGLRLNKLGQLIWDFPEIQAMVAKANFTNAALLGLAPPLLAKFIAAGIGELGDAKAEANIAALELGEQAEFIAAILAVSMPSGPVPFQKLMGLLGISEMMQAAMAAVPGNAAADAKGPAPGPRVRVMASRRPSMSSSAPAIN